MFSNTFGAEKPFSSSRLLMVKLIQRLCGWLKPLLTLWKDEGLTIVLHQFVQSPHPHAGEIHAMRLHRIEVEVGHNWTASKNITNITTNIYLKSFCLQRSPRKTKYHLEEISQKETCIKQRVLLAPSNMQMGLIITKSKNIRITRKIFSMRSLASSGHQNNFIQYFTVGGSPGQLL